MEEEFDFYKEAAEDFRETVDLIDAKKQELVANLEKVNQAMEQVPSIIRKVCGVHTRKVLTSKGTKE